MPATGLDSIEDQLLTYSVLGFYFDGTDYSDKSAKVVSGLITRMDRAKPTQLDAEPIEDEDHDRYGFRYRGIEYWFTSPSVRNMPRQQKNNLPGYYRDLINKLAEVPEQITDLPYYLFPVLGDALGKCLGIA
jgi:hypothetical protein